MAATPHSGSNALISTTAPPPSAGNVEAAVHSSSIYVSGKAVRLGTCTWHI